jgi:hypothetical protein
MKKLYLALMLAFAASQSLYAQRVSEGFTTSLTPAGWTTSNISGLLLWESTANAFQTTLNVGAVKSDNYNVGYETSTLETYTFSPTAAGDSLRFDIAACVYNDPPDLYTDSLTIYAYNGTTYSVLRAWETQLAPDTGITTVAGNANEFVPTLASDWRTKVIALPVGTTRLLFSFTSQYGNSIYLDNVIVDSFYVATMTYASSTTTQTDSSIVLPGSKNQQIIGIQVNVTGNLSPLSVTDFYLSTGSSNSPAGDIDSARIYSTGNSPIFSTANYFGGVQGPAGSFSINGTQQLQLGTNYFWMVYDIKGTATSGDVVDANCDLITVGGFVYAPTVTSPSGSRKIAGPLAGNLSVGAASPDYSTLTALFADLNARGVSAPVTISLEDTAYSANETFPITIGAIPGTSSTNTITIKPASGASPIIRGSSATAIIKAIGTDYLIIDGSNNGTSSRDLRIVNTNTTGTVLWIGNSTSPAIDAASNVTVKNCIVTGNTPASTISGVLVSSGATMGSAAETSNNNISIINNVFTRAQNGIFAIGNATTLDSGWVISNNILGSATASDKMGYRGIAVQNARYFNVEGNSILGIVISGTNPAAGILVGAALNTGTVNRNNITNVANTNTSGYGALGIYVNSGSTNANLTISNNFISEVTGYGYASGWGANDNGYGIMLNNGGNIKVYFNTISLTANQGRAGNTAAINIEATASNLTIRNNIFINAQTTGTRYAIYSLGTAGALTDINYNNYVASGVGYLGSAKATLADWQAATSQDVYSKNVAVTTVSASDLHLTGASVGDVNLACPPVAGIATDIDGDVRNTVTPWHYMGADENIGSPLPVEFTGFTAEKVKNAALLEWTTASEINNDKFVIERSLDARNFSAIGSVKGAGNSKRTLSYNFTDEQAAAFAGAQGRVYYRIVQVDYNGKSSASRAVSVQFGKDRTNSLSAYPNPANNEVTLAIDAQEAGTMNVVIADVQGREVYAGSVEVAKGANNHKVDIRTLEAGIYFVKTTLNNSTLYYKIYKN